MELVIPIKEDALRIKSFAVVTWPAQPQQHSHYKLVYILAGQGHYYSDEHQYAYQSGDIFLLQPGYLNWFCGSQATRFCVVHLPLDLVREAHTIFGALPSVLAQSHFRGAPELSIEEKAYVDEQLAFCLREHSQPQVFGDSLLRASITSVLMLLRRAYLRRYPTETPAALSSESQVGALVEYVRQHLKEPARLTAAAIGAHFHQRARYVGQYFRQHLGRGLKRFVEENRIYAIQQELRYTDKTVSQLAFEYGFTDESHLGKTFKAITHQTPLTYRRTWAARLN